VSRDYRHGPKQSAPKPPKGKRPEQTDTRDAKLPTERRIKDVLRWATRHQDKDLFDDYDEQDF
jgi:hypothetical protein